MKKIIFFTLAVLILSSCDLSDVRLLAVPSATFYEVESSPVPGGCVLHTMENDRNNVVYVATCPNGDAKTTFRNGKHDESVITKK